MELHMNIPNNKMKNQQISLSDHLLLNTFEAVGTEVALN